MDRDLRNNALISNIAGNFVRAGQHRPLISPTSAVLEAQKTSLYNNLMESRDKRLKREDAAAAAEEALEQQQIQEVVAIRNKIAGGLDPEVAIQMFGRLGNPGKDATDNLVAAMDRKDAAKEMKWKEAEEKRKANKSPYDSDTQFYLNDPKGFADMQAIEQAAKGPLVVNQFGNPEGQKKVDAALSLYHKDPSSAEAQTALVDSYIAAGRPKEAKIIAEAIKVTQQLNKGEGEEERAAVRRSGAAQTDAMGKFMALKGLRQARKVALASGLGGTGTAAMVTSIGGRISEHPYSQIQTHVASMKSDSTLMTLKDLKDSGATLGAISKPELELLMTKYGLLDPSIKSEIFLERADDFENVYTAILDKITPEDARKHNIPMPEGWWEERASRLMGANTKEENETGASETIDIGRFKVRVK